MSTARKPRVVTFRVSEEEYQQLKHYARLSGLSLSDYLRAGHRPALTVTSTGPAPLSVTWRAS